MIRAGTLELRRHLRDDHVHRFGFAQAALTYQAIQPRWTRCVDEDDPVERVRHASLEEKGNVAHHEAIAALARGIDERGPHLLDLRMHDGIQLLQLRRIAAHDTPELA